MRKATLLIPILILFMACATALNPPILYAIDMTWSAPTTNADGTELKDLAGFKIYYSNTSGEYTQAQMRDAGINTNYRLIVPDGHWCLVVTSYDAPVGNESQPSNEFCKDVDEYNAVAITDFREKPKTP